MAWGGGPCTRHCCHARSHPPVKSAPFAAPVFGAPCPPLVLHGLRALFFRNPPVSYASETRRRRTFAIISHPDAGKTTLTEKLLLFSGAIPIAGAVKGRKA